MTRIDMPVPFAGPELERFANECSHQFDEDTGRCYDCDVRRGSLSADYPCGAPVPRQTVENGRVVLEQLLSRMRVS